MDAHEKVDAEHSRRLPGAAALYIRREETGRWRRRVPGALYIEGGSDARKKFRLTLDRIS